MQLQPNSFTVSKGKFCLHYFGFLELYQRIFHSGTISCVPIHISLKGGHKLGVWSILRDVAPDAEPERAQMERDFHSVPRRHYSGDYHVTERPKRKVGVPTHPAQLTSKLFTRAPHRL